jgi:uncharacterized repeat protein (TIGR03803 family)
MSSMRSFVRIVHFAVFACSFTFGSTLASAQTFEVLYTFSGTDGANPETQLTLDSDDNIYGTTNEGGTGSCGGTGCGTVFVISKHGTLLRSYSFNGADGAYPVAGVLRDSAGNLFGTTSGGGNYNTACGGTSGAGCGLVFRLTPSSQETIHKFSGAPRAWAPQSLLVEDEAGNLYGTSLWGGMHNNGGTAFMVSSIGKESVLYSFPGGANPATGMILLNGDLYGITGGSGPYGGILFQMTTSGEVTQIAGFGDEMPESLLATDAAGNLYGTTEYGGSNNSGTVFELSPNDSGGWTQTRLYVFCQLPQCADGERPLQGPLAIDSAGNIYGTTLFGGGSPNCNGIGCGAVFKLDPSGNETVLHSFTGGADGATPFDGLAMDSNGNLYGTAATGGNLTCPINPPQGCGVVFKITP